MASKLPNPAHLAIAACEHRWRQENRSAPVLSIPSEHSTSTDCYVQCCEAGAEIKLPSGSGTFLFTINLKKFYRKKIMVAEEVFVNC
jgi:hypothetical protein